jgi:hypothetical protein
MLTFISCTKDAGVNGLSALCLIKEIVHKLDTVTGSMEDLPPCEYFDIMIGSGTGA